jgi:hypothetical protein
MTYTASVVPTVVVTVLQLRQVPENEEKIASAASSYGGCGRLGDDGYRATLRKECVRPLATLECIEGRPAGVVPATTIHCLVTSFRLRVPIAYSSLAGGSHGSHYHQGFAAK